MIDDDRALCALLKDYLEPMGYEMVFEHHGSKGLERALSDKFQAIILDVMLPGIDGFEILKKLRSSSETPVLMLTARGEEADRIVGLEMGADDYLPKGFSPRELLARIRAITRRSLRPSPSKVPSEKQESSNSEIVVGPLKMDVDARSAKFNGQSLTLTALEFDLLLSLAKARGRVKSREELIEAIAQRNYDVFDRSIDVHIWSLRKKLGDDPKNPRLIRTVRAVGYMLINPEAD